MKIYSSLGLFLGLFALAAACGRADDNDQTAKPVYDPDINSPTYDGSTFTTGQSAKPSADEVQSNREEQQAEATWLIRGYEQQEKLHSIANNPADSLDPYERISSNKDLAKLAGLTSTASPSPSDISPLRAASDSGKDGPSLRLGSSLNSSSPQEKFEPIMSGGFKPLITPLSATEVAGLHNFYSTLPAGTPAPVTASTPTQVETSPTTGEPPVTDMPGVAAAGNHITQGNLTFDLTYEPLPDDFHDKSATLSGDKNDGVLPELPSGDPTGQANHAPTVVSAENSASKPNTPAKVVLPPDSDLTPKPIAAPAVVSGRPQIQSPNNAFQFSNDFLR